MTAVEVSHTVAGPEDAPVVVLSNSLGATRAMWDPQVPALAERYRVVSYDTRGHGASPAPAGPYTLDDLVDDVLALLDRVGAERAHLVGLSLGGMTALRLAAREPQRVHRLAVLCTSAKTEPQGFLDRAAAVRADGTAPIAEAVVSRWLTPPYAAGHPELVARLQAMVAGCDDEGYAACAEVVAGIDLRDDLSRVAAPTLVVSGAEDQALPPAHQQAIADGIGGAELLTVSPGAHLANLEQPLQVTGALLGHLDAAGSER
ncbi:3-oxoadipate enol-lactonase [Modestobacter italicus]|uniref:3-oxoadipate enol-lactonase n=1 Tax=Modestobacter italicus (strain DSM 44449 / CECT 9708 / BC 501) TaxID=2732864 RepID=I4F4C1_MODI5|nr:3-oxoadipate enol-lactonase [Modestobacter marinus]CCH90484.1 3-oxoadipate enol-lactonase [Modestobacter marinus]